MMDKHEKTTAETIFEFFVEHSDEEFSVNELYECLPVEYSTWKIYYHVKRFTEAELLIRRKRAATNFFRLADLPEGDG